MKGTRLWQAPGSPIIQGRSRTERPFWERWLGGVAGAVVVMFAVGFWVAFRKPDAAFGASFASAAVSYVVPSLPGSIAGAALGVWVSRIMGWRNHWVVGSVCGAGLGAILIAVL